MSFSRLQILFVILLFSGISNHVLIIPHLLGVSKRDAWVCILISYAILLIWAKIYSLIFSKNKERQPLHVWLQMKSGKLPSRMILSLFFIFILLIGFITFYDLIVSVKIYFLPMTPIAYLVIPFLLLCIWAAGTGFKTIVYASAVILPIIWALGHFVAMTTMEQKDYSYLLPLFADDEASLLRGIVIILAGSVDLIILFLLQQYFNKPISYLYLVIVITLLIGLTIGPTIGSIAAFGPNIAATLRFPAFEQWRLVTLGVHISHVDALAVFQLVCGAIIRVSLCLYLLPTVINIKSVLHRRIFITLTASIYALFMFFHLSDIWMQTVLRNYFYPFISLLGIGITFALFIISYFPKREVPMTYES